MTCERSHVATELYEEKNMPTMYSLWRASTIVFVLQLIVGVLVFTMTGDVPASAIFVMAITLLIVSGLLGDDVANWIGDDIQMVSVPAVTAAGIVAFLAIPKKDLFDFIGGFTALILTFLLTSTIALVITRGRKGSMLNCFIAVLPLGLSTIIAGSLLLFWHLHETSEPIEPMS